MRGNNSNNNATLSLTFFLVLCVLSCIIHSSVADLVNPLVIGHRGFPKVAPENTMPSFKYAMENGVDGIETDLRFTKDGVLVCLHDETLDRTTNCTGLLSNYTWEEVQSCDASYGMSQFAGTKIPKFSEVVEFARAHNLFVIMDYKSGIPFASTVAEIVANITAGDANTSADLVSNLVGSCWKPWQQADIAANLTGSPVQYLTSGLPWNVDGFWKSSLNTVIRGFSINYLNISKTFVDNAHRRLMGVTVWTVDEPEDLKNAISWGVDAIITNDCVTLKMILNEHKNGPNNDIDNTGEVKSWVVGVVAVMVCVVTTAVVGVIVHIRTKRSLYSVLDSPAPSQYFK